VSEAAGVRRQPVSGGSRCRGSRCQFILCAAEAAGVSSFCAPWKGVGLQWVKFPPGNWVAPAGSYRSGSGGDKTVGAFETDASPRRCSEPTGRNVGERRAGLETTKVASRCQAWFFVFVEPAEPGASRGQAWFFCFRVAGAGRLRGVTGSSSEKPVTKSDTAKPDREARMTNLSSGFE